MQITLMNESYKSLKEAFKSVEGLIKFEIQKMMK